MSDEVDYGSIHNIDGKENVKLLSQLECEKCGEKAVNVFVGDNTGVYIKCHSCSGVISVTDINTMINKLMDKRNGKINKTFFMNKKTTSKS